METADPAVSPFEQLGNPNGIPSDRTELGGWSGCWNFGVRDGYAGKTWEDKLAGLVTPFLRYR